MDDHGLETFDRAEFLTERWDYQPGEHVTFLGPTGSGKTHLAYQVLQATANPRLPALVLVMKPRDATARQWSKTLNMPIIRTYPPPLTISTLTNKKPPGETLWPRHVFNPDADDLNMWKQFRPAILDSYKRGNRIVFADEVAGLEKDLGLTRELDTLWMRGRSMGTGLWAASQRPRHISLNAYAQAAHLFLFKDPDKNNRDRFREIGGVDGDLVVDAVMSLGRHDALYIRRDGPALCIVAA
jgi:hypothetical protein